MPSAASIRCAFKVDLGGVSKSAYRLDKKAVKDIMLIEGKTSTPADNGGYLVVFQRYGEFTATLGILRNGKPMTLYQDSYALK